MKKINKSVVILGPTASGKTTLSINLAKKFNGEIICADSRTVYQEMNVGTAKPEKKDLDIIVHHLLNICKPDQKFSVADFKKLANKAILQIYNKSKLPFLVGGSGLYIDALLFDYKFRNIESKTTDLSKLSLLEIQKLAKKKFPTKYNEIDIKNRRRVEQLVIKGPAKDNDRQELKNSWLVLGIAINNLTLRQNIVTRTKKMLNNNLIQEVEGLLKKYGQTEVLTQTTGYAEVIEYLNGNLKKGNLEAAIVNSTWQLSRKQMTWFRRNKYIKWINNQKQAEEEIGSYLLEK